MARSCKKSDYEHVLIRLFKDAVGNPIDLIIRNTCTDKDIFDLINKPRQKLEQMSTMKEDETLTL